jgi:5-oxopent-3-ene-1,2,5-tricarboxylate decarboxylase/2-hydroxyhepta-2,4-diene-1,7-dioate isomerase
MRPDYERGDYHLKFVCYKEFDDSQEPVLPGIFYKGKTLPLARVVAVAEALAPKGLSIPSDLNLVIGRLAGYAGAVRDLEKARVLDKLWQEAGVTALAPLPSPHRILAIGRNYGEHAKEMGNDVPDEPIVFQKASTSVIADGQPIVLPPNVGRIDFEGELAVVIGTAGKNVPESEALSLVAGYTLLNDVTARDEQKRAIGKSLPWFLSKSYDTFGPLGPYLVTPDEIPDPQNLELTLSVNGEIKQQANTSEMLFSIPYVIAYLSRHFALAPGDVIATGTPRGVGPLSPGDLVEVRIPEIGTLANPVIGEDEVF